jgi:hypothetical protein
MSSSRGPTQKAPEAGTKAFAVLKPSGIDSDLWLEDNGGRCKIRTCDFRRVNQTTIGITTT